MKLLTLLNSLHNEEYKDFEKFLQSPFFKASERFLKFFKCLCKHYPAFDMEKADLEAAYRRCFGPNTLNETKLYNLMSGLSKQIEQYLVVRMVLSADDKHGLLYEQLLTKSLGQRNMGPYFRKEAQRLIDETMKHPRYEIDDYLALNQIHHEIYFNPDTPKFEEHPPHLKLAVEHLDLYYCLAKLRYAAEMKTRERIYHYHYEFPLLEAVATHIAAPERLDAHPLLAIYYRLVNLYQKGITEPDFRELMRVFVEKFHVIPKVEQRALLPHLMNCGSALMNRDCVVEAELLSLYKLAIDTKVLLTGDRITHISFLNIVNLAGLCNEYDWANSFIEQFSPYLEENKREPAVDLAKAGLYYKQGWLDKAQTFLKPEIFQISLFDIIARAILIRIAFDRYVLQGKDYEFLTAQINAFEKFVPSQTFSATKRATQLNWVRFVRKMATAKFEMVEVPESKKGALRRSLKPLQPVISKKWLEERIEWL